MSPTSRAFRRGSSESASGITKPKPSRCMLRRPTAMFLPGGGLRNRIAVGADLLQLAARHQVLEALEQFAAGISVDAEFARHLLEAGSAFGLLLDLLQDGGIGKHSDGCHS